MASNIKWKGYCIECCKWRHSKHTIQNIRSGEMRCKICITRLLMICPVCEGEGKLSHKEGKEQCGSCAGHRVIPQQPIEEVK